MSEAIKRAYTGTCDKEYRLYRIVSLRSLNKQIIEKKYYKTYQCKPRGADRV